MPREDFVIFSSIRSGTWPPTRDSTSVKSGIVSFVFCNRQLCNSFKGSDSMVSGRPQIRDRSSSWNTTSSVACQMDIQFDPISMGDSGTERRYGIFGNPFFNTMISTMGEHRVKKWTDLSFSGQSRPDQIKVK